MKKTLSILIAMIMIVACIPATAFATESEMIASGTCGESVTWELVNDGTLTISGSGDIKDYTLPEDTPWDKWYDEIKRVVINNGVTKIGSSCFWTCFNIESVIIPDSVTKIGKKAFYGCGNLKNINVPNNVSSIGEDAFVSVGNVLYSGSASGEPWGAAMVNAYVEDNLTYTDSSKRYLIGCSTAATEVTIPSSVIDIGPHAFSGCTNLTKVIIPSSVATIGSRAFSGCTNLTKVIIPSSVKRIDDYTFSGCTSLTSAEISNSVTHFGIGIFYDCSNLKNVKLPDNLELIPDSTFANCNSLENITWPKSIRTIEYGAFMECTGIKSLVIPDSVTTIENRAFDGCDGLEEVTIGKGVTYIGEAAFECTGLSKLTIPGNVKTIENQAFKICTDLKEVTLISGIESIGERAFGDCDALESISIPDSVTEIGSSAFEHCYGLKTVTLGNGLAEIADGLFNCCTSLENISIPKNVKRIGSGSFAKCISLTYLDLPANVDTISQFAFWGCKNLQLVKLNSSDINLGQYPFVQCDNLVVQCPAGANYLSQLNKENVDYTTNICPIPTDHIVDVTEEAKYGYPINLSWLYELEYVDITNSKLIDRISHNNSSYRKLYDDLYAILSNPDVGDKEKLRKYSLQIGEEWEKATPYISYVLSALTDDHPELFWFIGSSYTQEEDYTASGFEAQYYFDTWEEIKSAKDTFDAKVNELISQTNGMSDYEKVCYFSQYFMDNCEYNDAYGNESPTNFQAMCALTAYGAIMGQKGDTGPICESYAAGMKVLCDAANIPCTIVGGTHSGTPHAWNAIEINGEWYDWEPQHPNQRNDDGGSAKYYEKDLISPVTVGFYDTASSVHCEAGTHTWSTEYTVISQATCKDNKVVRYICKTCGDYKTEDIEGTKAEHAWKQDYTVDIEASCTEAGSKSIHCSMCGVIKEGSSIVIPAEHVWNQEFTVDQEASCTEGYKSIHCSVCDAIKEGSSVVIPAEHVWNQEFTVDQEASCTEGYKSIHCSICDAIKEGSSAAIPAIHQYGSYKTTTKAKFGKNGVQAAKCTSCGKSTTKSIAAPKTIKLSYSTYTYNSKVKKPTVTVYNSAGKKISSSSYTVSYASGRKNVGKYKVTVTFKKSSNSYAGSSYTTFKINPKPTTISLVSKGKKSFTVKWKKQSGKMAASRITGYQYRYSTSSKMTNASIKTVKGYSKTSAKKTGLKAKKKYYVQVRTYKTVNGTKYYSSWSKSRSVTTK